MYVFLCRENSASWKSLLKFKKLGDGVMLEEVMIGMEEEYEKMINIKIMMDWKVGEKDQKNLNKRDCKCGGRGDWGRRKNKNLN